MTAPARRRLLVTGASGLFGLNLGLRYASCFPVYGVANSHALTGLPFELLHADLAQPGAFRRLIEQVRPEQVIHAAALANLEACEKDPALSRRLNADLPGEVAEVCARQSIPLVHLSTDAVFDGERGDYREEDVPNPLGVYAVDKLAGEQAAASANPAAVIARVNFYGWSLSGRRSLGEVFVHALAAGQAVNGFHDVIFRPLHVDYLADALLEMLDHGLSGLYHVLGRECLSKYQFALDIAARFGFDPSLVRPISVRDSGLTARRSPNLTLRVDKLEAALGHAMPGRDEMLAHFHRQYLDGYPQFLRAFAEKS